MKGISAFLLFAYVCLAVSCDETSPQSCNDESENSVKPVKIQYSANGVNLNIEIGYPSQPCDNSKPAPEFEACESCNNVPYGRVGYKDDCSRFCECVQGKYTKVGNCPDRLDFNAIKSVCDFKENANCGKVTTETTEPTTLLPDQITLFPLDPNCECGTSLSIVPYTGVCSKYCNCEDQTVHECPGNLYFDSVTYSCAKASEVDCPYDVSTTERIILPTPKYPPTTTERFTLPTPKHPNTRSVDENKMNLM